MFQLCEQQSPSLLPRLGQLKRKHWHHESFFRLLNQWKTTFRIPSASWHHRGAMSSANKLVKGNNDNTYSQRNSLECFFYHAVSWLLCEYSKRIPGFPGGRLLNRRSVSFPKTPWACWALRLCALKHQSQQRPVWWCTHRHVNCYFGPYCHCRWVNTFHKLAHPIRPPCLHLKSLHITTTKFLQLIENHLKCPHSPNSSEN